ncbi:TonB-dependent receptor, partial [candidate division KSB1 bacterium]
MNQKASFCPGTSLIILLMLSSIVFGATTGKIAGRIIDKESGEPLVGANIIIQGTGLGAAADVDGNFFIINIPPGRYVVQARMMGYTNTQVDDVRVRTNATTSLDLQLTPTVIEGETVVVTVDAIATKKDQTSSVRNISSDQIELLPVESVQQVVNMQAGVVNGHFRGGRTNEVSYMIDGLQVNDVYDKGRLTNVETEVIQDVEVILGTFNAEYGRAMSGIVNAVTKEGSEQFHGMVSGQLGNYFTSHTDIFVGLKPGDITRKTNLRAQVEGPIIKKYLSFFLNYRGRDEANHLNGIHRFNPADFSDYTSMNAEEWYSEHTGDDSYVPMSIYKGYSVYGKLTFRPFANLKANLIYNRTESESGAYQHYMRYNPYGVAHNYSDVNSYTFLLNHTISPKMFHELKINFVDNVYNRYVYENPTDARYVSDWYGFSTGPGFSTGSQDNGYTDNRTRRMDFNWDATWQVTRDHSLKAGFLLTNHDKDIREYQIVNVFRNNDIDRMRDTLWTPEGEIEKIAYPWYRPEILDDSTTYSNVYQKKPQEFSAYFQDKMEFNDLVINIGVRYDRFDPKTIYPSNLRNPGNKLLYQENPERMSDYPDAEIKDQLSPRFGLAYTLSDQAKLHFSYGHFFQMPDAYALYNNHNFIIP